MLGLERRGDALDLASRGVHQAEGDSERVLHRVLVAKSPLLLLGLEVALHPLLLKHGEDLLLLPLVGGLGGTVGKDGEGQLLHLRRRWREQAVVALDPGLDQLSGRRPLGVEVHFAGLHQRHDLVVGIVVEVVSRVEDRRGRQAHVRVAQRALVARLEGELIRERVVAGAAEAAEMALAVVPEEVVLVVEAHLVVLQVEVDVGEEGVVWQLIPP